ncbi:mcl1 [Symbiodinium necroappetens]|uniref:Mcl1 protein n=1 Tax=Symbiodinium necroappetens TaxID=1628268 RepID=A0A812RNN1_9DINO|nr:mcl1 [Symbiodinium necroappetens]
MFRSHARKTGGASPTCLYGDTVQVADVFLVRALAKSSVYVGLRLAEDDDALPVIATLFYRTRDYLNQEFWEDQIRRIGDIVAEEYFSHSRGVQLMVHHAPPSALGLEVGEHRLLAELEAMSFVGPQLGRRNIPEKGYEKIEMYSATQRQYTIAFSPFQTVASRELRSPRMLSRLAQGIRSGRVPAAVSGAFRNSFTVVQEATPRLNRCELYVPGTQAKIIPKAAKSAADVVVMDLEDSVAIGEKEVARKNVIHALKEVDFGNKTVAVRINGLYSHHMYRDVVDIIEQAGERCDMFVIPMVGNGKDVYMADSLVSQVEEFMGRKKKIGFGLIIEATLGMMNIHEIAAASKRNESLHFGVADYAASTKSRTTNIGGPNKLYGVLTDKDGDKARDFFWGDPWHYAMARIVVAARANGLRPVDGPFGDIADPDGYKAQCERGAALGMEGKWAIHPSQVALANEVFSPGEAEVKQARRVLEAMEKAQKEGLGAVSLDGKLVDIASIKQADAIVKKAEAIEAMCWSCSPWIEPTFLQCVPLEVVQEFQWFKVWNNEGEADVGLATDEEDQLLQERHTLFHRFVFDHFEARQPVPLPRGDYVLRVGGRPVCGLSVLGLQPGRLVCGGAWADEGREPELAFLAQQLRRRARKYACSVVYDSKDERSKRTCEFHSDRNPKELPSNWAALGLMSLLRQQDAKGNREGPSRPGPSRPSLGPSGPPRSAEFQRAATRIQARFRGVLGRILVAQKRTRLEQERAEEEHRHRTEAKREAAQEARRQAAQEAQARAAQERDEKLRALRERRCTLEQMCQGLPSHHMDWEESPARLLELLERTVGIGRLALCEAWLGCHSERRSARKRYLLLTRKWHPDKWAVQGERCVSLATEVAKQLVRAYEQACKELPNVVPPSTTCAAQEDNDEDRECYEFASWVGISFKGMEEVWKERLFTGSNGKEFGLVRRQQSLKIAVTGVPVGLSPEQQARLARASGP